MKLVFIHGPVAMGKYTVDLALYRQLRDTGAFATPLIPCTDLEIDTEKSSPADSAARIARHFKLG